MAVNTVFHQENLAANTSANPSPAIWARFPTETVAQDPSKGYHLFERFLHGGLITSPTTEAALVGLPYNGFGSSGATITYNNATAAPGGIILTEATDNEAVFFIQKTKPVQISANLGLMCFEARVKISNITTMNLVVGLWDDVTVTVDIPLSSANPPVTATTGNLVGFFMREAGAAVDTMYYADDSGSTVDDETVVQAGVHTMVADTYVKLGMVFEPLNGNKLSYWVNGVRQTSTVTVPDATGTTFPADRQLGVLIGHKQGATAACLTTINWFRLGQLYV